MNYLFSVKKPGDTSISGWFIFGHSPQVQHSECNSAARSNILNAGNQSKLLQQQMKYFRRAMRCSLGYFNSLVKSRQIGPTFPVPSSWGNGDTKWLYPLPHSKWKTHTKSPLNLHFSCLKDVGKILSCVYLEPRWKEHQNISPPFGFALLVSWAYTEVGEVGECSVVADICEHWG